MVITLFDYHLSYDGIFIIHGYQSLAMSLLPTNGPLQCALSDQRRTLRALVAP
jgi:hypothetical protein